MKILIMKLKVCEWASEETLCMSGEIWADGNPVATFDNDGRGGSTRIDPVKGVSWDAVYAVQDEVVRLDQSLASDSPREWLSSLDLWLSLTVERKLNEKNLSKEMRKKIIWQDDDGCWYSSPHTTHELDVEKFKDKVVLNYMPFYRAVDIWETI